MRSALIRANVLQEFYVQSTRRSRDGSLSHDQAVRLMDTFLRFPVQETSVDVLEAALAAAQRFRISFGTPRLSKLLEK
jgi:hypothetical protein